MEDAVIMKCTKHENKVLDATDRFGYAREDTQVSELTQLGESVIAALNDKNLKVSEVRPFFWSLVETYVDRFQHYPFDVDKAVISHLELKDYPEDAVRELVNKLEAQFEAIHNRPLRKSVRLVSQLDALDDDIKQLRDALKYAAIVAEDIVVEDMVSENDDLK